MLKKEELHRIYSALQNDTWQFTNDENSHYWTRTAVNHEVVGTSHKPFASLAECKANAKMVGFKNMFSHDHSFNWEFYKDKKNQYRWRLLSPTAEIIQSSHEGYKTEIAAKKNAVRHGYGLSEIVPNRKKLCCSTSLLFLMGVLLLIAALMLRSCFYADLPAKPSVGLVSPIIPVVSTGSDVAVYTQIFSDVPESSWYWGPVHAMHEAKIMTGYTSTENEALRTFKPEILVSLQQLAKIAILSTNTNISSCSGYVHEPRGQSWATQYIHCLRYRGVRVFESLDKDFTRPATRAEVVAVIIDAFGRSKELNPSVAFIDVTEETVYADAIRTLAHDRIVIGTGTQLGKKMFKPEDSISRVEMSALVHRTIDAYTK